MHTFRNPLSIFLATPLGHTGPSGSSMEEPAMVPHPTGHAGGLPSPPSSQEGPDYSNTPRECASNGPPTSRMAYLRQRFQSKEISEEGTELLLASWRQKSSKSHDSLFGKWVDWCKQRHSDPVSGPINRHSAEQHRVLRGIGFPISSDPYMETGHDSGIDQTIQIC